jgi:hypothetical protein
MTGTRIDVFVKVFVGFSKRVMYISAGNVLCVNGSGRLSDLEFCKNYRKTPAGEEHEGKTVSL